MIVDLIQVPALIFLIGSAVLAVLPAVVRKWSFLAIPAVAMAVLFLLPDGKAVTATLGTYELNLLKLDSLSRIFGIIFILILLAIMGLELIMATSLPIAYSLPVMMSLVSELATLCTALTARFLPLRNFSHMTPDLCCLLRAYFNSMVTHCMAMRTSIQSTYW